MASFTLADSCNFIYHNNYYIILYYIIYLKLTSVLSYVLASDPLTPVTPVVQCA